MRIASLLLALTAAAIVHFPGGTAVVTPSHGLQHVVVKNAHGTVTSDSYCDSSAGTYGEIVAFGSAIRNAVRRGDKAAVASLMQYPLRVNVSQYGKVGTRTLKNSRALLAGFGGVFSKSATQMLSRMEPHDVFCRNGMAMFAAGTLWAAKDRLGAIKGAIVNR